ncbi:hypothetical protein KP509_18G010700 [Ceratopteris richardii]|uniref:Uncharacterized protein n=1 Tax=Ceratopteris richardii TaxID=49495 RepID=A0A8T2SR57_CERRI|nr:hypothetical protein KP509_18G010700 [Ceratopteris richardii]
MKRRENIRFSIITMLTMACSREGYCRASSGRFVSEVKVSLVPYMLPSWSFPCVVFLSPSLFLSPSNQHTHRRPNPALAMATKSSPMAVYVQPIQPTPYEVIPLTGGSVMAGLNTLMSSHVLVFRPRPEDGDDTRAPVESVRSGLSRVLVPYYPLAGRIVETETGWEVQCDGQGAVFIVTAAVDVEEVPEEFFLVGNLSEPETVIVPPPARPPSPPPSHGRSPALIVQLDELGDGGFSLNIKWCKGICDAAGLMHFLNGWAEMAKGKTHISVIPAWGHKSNVLYGDPLSSATTSMVAISQATPSVNGIRGHHVPLSIHVPSLENGSKYSGLYGEQTINSLSKIYLFHDPKTHRAPIEQKVMLEIPYTVMRLLVDHVNQKDGYPCSVAQVLAAHLWRERTRAMRVPQHLETRLFFLSEARKGDPVGYYGSFSFNCQVKARVSDLINEPLLYAVQILQEAERDSYNLSACVNDFKQLHSSSFLPLEVLLFTSLPIGNVESQIDFGGIGRPSSSIADDIDFPFNVNIAALAPPTHANESVLRIFMNNIPLSNANELSAFLTNVPHFVMTDSKM